MQNINWKNSSISQSCERFSRNCQIKSFQIWLYASKVISGGWAPYTSSSYLVRSECVYNFEARDLNIPNSKFARNGSGSHLKWKLWKICITA